MRPTFTVRITPADIGRRVSVRARIPAEPGQPRHTDTIGYLRAWQDGALVIERADGDTVRISEHDVVAGRPVPPPPAKPPSRR